MTNTVLAQTVPPFSDAAWFFCANLISVVEGYLLLVISNNRLSTSIGMGALCFGALGMGANASKLLNF